MSKLPAFQFYPADWRKDIAVQSLTYEQKGIWVELLCIMHETEERGKLIANGLPIPCHVLARWLQLDVRKFNRIITIFITKKVAYKDTKTKVIYNKRMVEDERLMQVRRESGKKGGNPVLLNQKSNHIVNQSVNQNPTPSSSSSSSSSITENILWTDEKKNFLNDYNWKEKFCRDRVVNMNFLMVKMNEFLELLEHRDEVKPLKELKNHFTNWFIKNPDPAKSNGIETISKRLKNITYS